MELCEEIYDFYLMSLRRKTFLNVQNIIEILHDLVIVTNKKSPSPPLLQ